MSQSHFDPRCFRSAVPFYARYRLGYPDSLIARVVELVGLKRGDAVIDLGCGPGLLEPPSKRTLRTSARGRLNCYGMCPKMTS
jgi:hypothetical protein